MGGREAIRGFAVQTLICLLDSLWLEAEWSSVTLEPDSDNDKVDIQWRYANGTSCAQQVKSSKNQISKGDVVAWCKELKESKAADRYQLLLAGPIAAAVVHDAPFDGVDVPTPTSMDTIALLDQAITKVDRYLSSKRIEPLPLSLRESLVYELVARMLQSAIHGQPMGRDVFEGWLLTAITAAYPHAVSQRLSANCAVLWSVVDLAGPALVADRAFEIVLPLTVINGGASTAVVEFFLLRIWSPAREMRYRPGLVLPELPGETHAMRRRLGRPFGDFAIAPHSSVQQYVLFVPVKLHGYEVGEWPTGDYEVELFVKYASQPSVCSVKRATITIRMDDFSVLENNETRSISVSNVEKYLHSL